VRFAERGGCYRDQVSEMFSRGEFGNDAAVFRVQFYLRRDDGGEDAAVVDDGGAGFIAGGFEREEQGEV